MTGKTKRYGMLIPIVTLLIFACMLSSCSTAPNTPGSSSSPGLTASVQPTATPEGKNNTFSNMEGEFFPLSSAVINSDLPGTKLDENADKNSDGFCKVSAEVDLTGSGKVVVEILYSENGDGKLKIADKEIDFAYDFFAGADLINMDESDKSNEICIYTHGPSGTCSILLFAYDGSKITELFKNELDGFLSYENILCDKKGKVVHSRGYTDFVEPYVATQYFQMNGSALEEKNVEYTGVLNKEIALSKDVECAIKQSDNPTLEMRDEIDPNNTSTLKKGEKIKLLAIDSKNNIFYCMELPDGKKAVITTQLAG